MGLSSMRWFFSRVSTTENRGVTSAFLSPTRTFDRLCTQCLTAAPMLSRMLRSSYDAKVRLLDLVLLVTMAATSSLSSFAHEPACSVQCRQNTVLLFDSVGHFLSNNRRQGVTGYRNWDPTPPSPTLAKGGPGG